MTKNGIFSTLWVVGILIAIILLLDSMSVFIYHQLFSEGIVDFPWGEGFVPFYVSIMALPLIVLGGYGLFLHTTRRASGHIILNSSLLFILILYSLFPLNNDLEIIKMFLPFLLISILFTSVLVFFYPQKFGK